MLSAPAAATHQNSDRTVAGVTAGSRGLLPADPGISAGGALAGLFPAPQGLAFPGSRDRRRVVEAGHGLGH